MSLSVRTDVGAPDTYVGGTGLTITGGGVTVTFDEVSHIEALQKSSVFLALLTDDAFGAGTSTLVLVDGTGTDVPQGLASDFLAAVGGPSKISAHKRDSVDHKLIYFGRSAAAEGSENEAAFEWQIYVTDDRDTVFARTFVKLDEAFVYRWDEREQVNFVNYYVTTAEPTIGAANVLLGWIFDEPSGDMVDVKAVQNATAGAAVTRATASGATQWPLGAYIANAPSGDVITVPHPAGGELDFGPTSDFSFSIWVRGDNISKLSGLLAKRNLAGTGPGFSIAWVTSTGPDILQFNVYDGTGFAQKSISDNALSDDTWHLWTFVHDGTAQTIRAWLDKVEQGTGVSVAALGSYANTEALTIGKAETPLQLTGAYFGPAFFCSTLLSQVQIDALVDGGP